jgi:molecular chaperone HscB
LLFWGIERVNYFEVFGLPRRLEIDTAELQRRFYELSRRHHPDFHHGASPEAQAEALEASALLNAAYRALRDPIARIEYLVRLEEGRDTREGREVPGGRETPGAAGVKPQAPPELLAEMFEIQESLAEARTGTLDDATRETLRDQRERLLLRHREEEARLTGPLSRAWDAADAAGRPGALRAFKEALATRAYLRTVIADLGEALECEPQDVR